MTTSSNFQSLDPMLMTGSQMVGFPKQQVEHEAHLKEEAKNDSDWLERQTKLYMGARVRLPIPVDAFLGLSKNVIPALVGTTRNNPAAEQGFITIGRGEGFSFTPPIHEYQRIGDKDGLVEISRNHRYHTNRDKPPVFMGYFPMLVDVAKAYGDEQTLLTVSLDTTDVEPKRSSEYAPTVHLLTVSQEGFVTPRGWLRAPVGMEVNSFNPAESKTGVYKPRIKGDSESKIPQFDLGAVLSRIANYNKEDGDQDIKLECRIAIDSLTTGKNGGAGVGLLIKTDKLAGAGEMIPGGQGRNPIRFTLIEDKQVLME